MELARWLSCEEMLLLLRSQVQYSASIRHLTTTCKTQLHQSRGI